MAKIIMDENETVNEAVEVENTEAPELDADFSVDADSVENTSTDTEPPTDDSEIDTDMSVETPEETTPTDKEESSDNTQAEGNPDENIDNSGDDGITSLPLDDADLKPVYDEATGQADSVGVGKKWTDGYTIKKKPSDDDEAMILSTSEKANKRIKFSGIWDWIVDKMATAVVSKLTTADKTVLGAINELNSKGKTIEIINISKKANISKNGEFVYSGLEFCIPKESTFIVEIRASYATTYPLGVAITNSKVECSNTTLIAKVEQYPATMTYIFPINNTDKTYYVWVNYNQTGTNTISVRGISIK
mgnify:CR=1 FL=1